MPVVKVKTSNAPAGDGNDSLSTIVKQGIGKAPSLPMSADNPVQWIQLLHAFDNHDLPGWPLLSPVKLQMQKCEKCNRDFFAPINHRRHIRVHHRLKKLDKDSLKNRDMLRVFWDKLSVDEAKDIVALKNASVEDLPGGTVIKALTSAIRKPGCIPVPPLYIKSGSALLEIVHARSSRFPISSQEFFSILDDASEKTFLSGPAIAMQKYLFDGEVGKIGLDAKNLVAFTSFILEQKLVEAWLADKDAEALRCQKLLVEEEEAAQKRQAELLERKKRKKLRQKEQKAKEHRNEEAEVKNSFDPMEAEPPVEIVLEHADAPQLARQDPGGPSEMSLAEISQLTTSEEEDSKAQTGVGFVDNDYNTCENVELQSNRPLGVPCWHVPPKPRAMSNGVYQIKSLSTSKPEFKPKHGIRDVRVAHTVNNKKVWSRKPKPEKDGEDLKFRVREAFVQVGQDKKHELLIGSIAVNLGSSDIPEKCDGADLPVDDCKPEYQTLKKVSNIKERSNKSDSIQGGVNQPTVKHWRRRKEVKDSTPVPTEAKVHSSALKDDNLVVIDGSCFRSSAVNGDAAELGCTPSPTEGERPGNSHYSCEAARTFLSRRWKEAVASDHVKLVLSPEPDPPAPGTVDRPEDSDADGRSILGNAENRMANGPHKKKPEKGLNKRYIPKQRANGT